jgi:hypothetical protein
LTLIFIRSFGGVRLFDVRDRKIQIYGGLETIGDSVHDGSPVSSLALVAGGIAPDD